MLFMLRDSAGMDRGVVFQSDAKSLRHSRKLLHGVLHPKSLDGYDEDMRNQLQKFLSKLLQNPLKFGDHIR